MTILFCRDGELYFQVQHFENKKEVHMNLLYN